MSLKISAWDWLVSEMSQPISSCVLDSMSYARLVVAILIAFWVAVSTVVAAVGPYFVDTHAMTKLYPYHQYTIA